MNTDTSLLGHTSAQHWHDLPYKDKVAHLTAIFSFIFGWIITFVGLLLPPQGEIDGTVITVFGIAIGYTGGMYGIINYIKNGQSELYSQLIDDIKKAQEKKE